MGNVSSVTKEFIYQHYVLQGLSDRQIGEKLNMDRSSVSSIRRKFKIPKRPKVGEIAEKIVKQELINRGFNVVDLNQKNKASVYDLLVNDFIKIEVKSSKRYKDFWHIHLGNKPDIGIDENNPNYMRLSTGRLKKDYKKTCDFLIICCLYDAFNYETIIVPSEKIPEYINGLTITKGSKWWEWQNRWDLLI